MDLLKAVQKGDIEYVKANIDSDTWFKNTPWSDYILLNTSIQHNRRKITKFFLDKDFRVNCTDGPRSENTPLHGAIAKKDISLINILLKKNALVDASNANDDTPAHLAAKSKKCEIVNAVMPYVKIRKKSNFVNREGLSHLHVACMSNNVSVVKNFLNQGVDIRCPVNMNSSLWPGFTPLHFAVYNKRTETAEVLLQRGADPNATDAKRVTPLHLAFRKKNQHLVNLMLEKYDAASMNLIDDMQVSYFHIACSQDSPAILDKYLGQAFDINGCISFPSSYLSGYTPLHVAVQFGCDNAVTWLLKHRADFTKCNNDGFTPLHLAFWRRELKIIGSFMAAIAEYNLYNNPVDIRGVSFFHISCLVDNPQVVQEFINHGADINKPIKKSAEKLATCTPLHLAVRFENPGSVAVLLSNKADIHAVDIKGETPLHYVCQGNDVKLAALLQIAKQTYRGNHDMSRLQAHLNKSLDILRLLITYNVNVNIKDTSYLTPLFHMFNHRYDVNLIDRLCEVVPMREQTYRNRVLELITECRNEMIRLILPLKPALKLKDERRYTLLHHLAARLSPEFVKDQAEIAQLMIENGAKVNAKNELGETPLFMAAFSGNEALVDVLLVYGADVNLHVELHPLATPLAAAVDYLVRCHNSHMPRIVSKLIIHGADVNARLPSGRTVLHEVFGSGKFGDIREFKFICVSDCDLNVQEEVTGRTALHLATIVGDVDAIDWLLYCGARHDLKDHEGFDPVHYCAQNPEKTGYVYYNHFQRLRLIGYRFQPTFDSNLAIIKNGSERKYILNDKEFHNELEGLKKFTINKYTSLYNLLFQSSQEMVKYVNNQKLHRMLTESSFCASFPLYGSLIAIKYRKSMFRHSLLKPSMDSFNILVANALPENVAEKVLGFLSDADVKNIIVATKVAAS